jgi:hypothetical protein
MQKAGAGAPFAKGEYGKGGIIGERTRAAEKAVTVAKEIAPNQQQRDRWAAEVAAEEYQRQAPRRAQLENEQQWHEAQQANAEHDRDQAAAGHSAGEALVRTTQAVPRAAAEQQRDADDRALEAHQRQLQRETENFAQQIRVQEGRVASATATTRAREQTALDALNATRATTLTNIQARIEATQQSRDTNQTTIDSLEQAALAARQATVDALQTNVNAAQTDAQMAQQLLGGLERRQLELQQNIQGTEQSRSRDERTTAQNIAMQQQVGTLKGLIGNVATNPVAQRIVSAQRTQSQREQMRNFAQLLNQTNPTPPPPPPPGP